MKPYIVIGSSPSHEDCAQVGSEDYATRSRAECKRFIAQLRRTFGPEPDGAGLGTKEYAHDFGTYREVVCYFDETKPTSEAYAYRVEAECPAYWDEVVAKACPWCKSLFESANEFCGKCTEERAANTAYNDGRTP